MRKGRSGRLEGELERTWRSLEKRLGRHGDEVWRMLEGCFVGDP